MEHVLENLKKSLADKKSFTANVELVSAIEDPAVLQDFVQKGGVSIIEEGMKKHSRDPEVLICGLCLLSRLLHQVPKSIGRTERRLAVLAALRGIKECQEDIVSQTRGFEFLCEAVKGLDDDSWEKIGCYVGAMAGAMSKHIEDKPLQRAGVQLFSLLYLNAHGNKVDPEGEGIKASVNAMNAFAADAHIQKHGLGVMGLIQLGDKEQQKHILSFGGIDAAVRAMTRLKEDSDVQGWGCYALGSAGVGNKETQCAIQKRGGVNCVVNALSRFQEDENVQEWGIRTLAFLAYDNLDVQIELYASGIEIVLGSMKKHSGHAGIQGWGNNLISCLSDSDQTLFRDKIIALNGVEVVVDGMRKHKEEKEVQKSGVQALGLLASKKCKVAQHQIVIEQDGLNEIMSVMIFYETSQDVISACCSALSELMAGNPEVQEKFGLTFSGMESVMAAIANYEGCVELQREAWGLLAIATDNARCIEKFITYDGVETTRNAMTKYSTDDWIQKSCLDVLINVGMFSLK